MTNSRETSSLRGVLLAVADLGEAARLTEHVLALPSTTADADHGSGIRFAIGPHAFTLRQQAEANDVGELDGSADTVQWQCADLERQCDLLAHLGIDTLEAGTTAFAQEVCVGSADTGACAAAWVAGADSTEPPRDTARIGGLVLQTRAPQRVAAHWAQMLQVPVGRDGTGTPWLNVHGVALRFVFADKGVDKLQGLTVALPDIPAAQAAQARALALGLGGPGSDIFSIEGLQIRVTSYA